MTVCDIQSHDELGSLSNSLNTFGFKFTKMHLDELNKANKQLKKDVQHEKDTVRATKGISGFFIA